MNLSLVIMMVCGFIFGTLLATMGYPLTTWQYWVLFSILVVSYIAGGLD